VDVLICILPPSMTTTRFKAVMVMIPSEFRVLKPKADNIVCHWGGMLHFVRIIYIYIKSYFATRFIIFDDIEEEIVVLSGNWRFGVLQKLCNSFERA
jgi:hypothetical protein